MNSLSVLALIVLVQIGLSTVNGAPTWIPSNVTFTQLNDTHVQIKYKDKVIETVNMDDYATNTKKPNTIIERNREKSPNNLETIKEYNRKWIRVNLCYFNPVTCFAGDKE